QMPKRACAPNAFGAAPRLYPCSFAFAVLDVPISTRAAISFSERVVSRRSRAAISTLQGSLLRRWGGAGNRGNDDNEVAPNRFSKHTLNRPWPPFTTTACNSTIGTLGRCRINAAFRLRSERRIYAALRLFFST